MHQEHARAPLPHRPVDERGIADGACEPAHAARAVVVGMQQQGGQRGAFIPISGATKAAPGGAGVHERAPERVRVGAGGGDVQRPFPRGLGGGGVRVLLLLLLHGSMWRLRGVSEAQATIAFPLPVLSQSHGLSDFKRLLDQLHGGRGEHRDKARGELRGLLRSLPDLQGHEA